MRILKEEQIKQFISNEEVSRPYSKNKNHNELNKLFSLYVSLRKNLNVIPVDEETLYYSVYFWFIQFKKQYYISIGKDEGLEQEGFKLLEEIDHELEEGIDWNVVTAIENSPSEQFQNAIIERGIL